MAQSVETTQEIKLEDIVEMSYALTESAPARESGRVSSVELGDDDLVEEPSVIVAPDLAHEAAPLAAKVADAPETIVQDAEDLVSTRVQPSRVTTAVMATLRVPSLTLAQAMSALGTVTSKTNAPSSNLTRFTRWSRQLPAPIWASISAAVAALVVGSAALAATHGSDDTISVQMRVAEREEPQDASKAMRRKYTTSEQLGRWSETPTYVADVSVSSLPKR